MAEVANQSTTVEKAEPTFPFGKKEKRLITDPLGDNNPITIQVLGICSALAVTTQVVPSVIISIAVVFVCAVSNVTISVLRNSIPKQVRMIVQLVVIAALVTIVELVLKAVNYEVYKQLSVFIGLIITNCIIMGRLEAFAMANNPWRSFLDGVGNGLGYGGILIIVAVLREFFGKGSFAGIKLIGPSPEYALNTADSALLGWYAPNNLFVFPPAAMFIIAILIWIQRSYRKNLVDIS